MRHLVIVSLLLPITTLAQMPDGPDAPDMSISYADGEGFSFALSNTIASNNHQEMYVEQIIPGTGLDDPYWRFQGYVIYQFATPGDADDSLVFVLRDPLRARPMMIVDVADGVQLANLLVNPNGTNPCTQAMWYLLDQGIPPELIVPMDPWTLEPHSPNTEYCFAALAFAYNAQYIEPDCGLESELYFSKKSAGGPLHVQCVIGAEVGLSEAWLNPLTWGPVPAGDELRLNGLPNGITHVRCVNALGAVVYDGTIHDGGSISTASWSSGHYTAHLIMPDGHRAAHPFLVRH